MPHILSLSLSLSLSTTRSSWSIALEDAGLITGYIHGRQFDYTVDFGKYEGMSIHDVPENYLDWCQRQQHPIGRMAELLEARDEMELQSQGMNNNTLEHDQEPAVVARSLMSYGLAREHLDLDLGDLRARTRTHSRTRTCTHTRTRARARAHTHTHPGCP